MSFFAVCIFLTKSRGGLILLIIVFSFLILFCNAGKYKSIKSIVGFCFIVFLAILFFNNKTIASFFAGNESSDFTTGRFEIWNRVLSSFSIEYLLFGTGYISLYGHITGAHNLLIDILTKTGIIGSILSLSLFIVVTKRGFSVYRRERTPYFLIFLCIIINSLFEVCYFAYGCDCMLWLFASILTSKYEFYRKETKYEV